MPRKKPRYKLYWIETDDHHETPADDAVRWMFDVDGARAKLWRCYPVVNRSESL